MLWMAQKQNWQPKNEIVSLEEEWPQIAERIEGLGLSLMNCLATPRVDRARILGINHD